MNGSNQDEDIIQKMIKMYQQNKLEKQEQNFKENPCSYNNVVDDDGANVKEEKEDENIIQRMIEMYQERELKKEQITKGKAHGAIIDNQKIEMDQRKEEQGGNIVKKIIEMGRQKDMKNKKKDVAEDSYKDSSDQNGDKRCKTMKKTIILSTRFSLGGYISNTVKTFAHLLQNHPFFQDYEVYYPNTTKKSTCDPNWTDFHHPCLGTFDTCGKAPALKLGPPREEECCWRYSFRYNIERAFVMVQVVEYYHGQFWDHGDDGNFIIGKGQRIETEIAKDSGKKVFRCFQPTHQAIDTWIKEDFALEDIDCLAEEVKRWIANGCADMDEHDLEFNYGEDLKCHSLIDRVVYDDCIMNECVFFSK